MTKHVRSFWERISVAEQDRCWLWQGAVQSAGYGVFRTAGVLTLAHRAAYEASVGAIPESLTIDHLCRNRACCNPAHMQVVSRGENARRGVAHRTVHRGGRHLAERSHCKNGHEFTSENTRMEGSTRRCKPCAKVRSAEFRERRRANV